MVQHLYRLLTLRQVNWMNSSCCSQPLTALFLKDPILMTESDLSVPVEHLPVGDVPRLEHQGSFLHLLCFHFVETLTGSTASVLGGKRDELADNACLLVCHTCDEYNAPFE